MERDSSEQLPEEIIQHILSFLPAEETVKVSLLSKTWLNALSKISILDFHYYQFQDKFFPGRTCENQFVEFVDSALCRHCEHDDISIDNFKLFLQASSEDSISRFKKWLQLVFAKDVKRLALLLHVPNDPEFYNIPQTILNSNSFVDLWVSGHKGHEFNLRHREGLKKCYTLKLLHIEGVKVKGSTIRNLSYFFPCIEELVLKYCFRLREIELSGLPNLKEFELSSSVFVPVVKISDAHSLESFIYCSNERIPGEPQYFDISPTRGLKYLSLADSGITDSSLSNLISHCPFLEELELRNGLLLERISISSRTLKFLTLCNHRKLQEVKIDAPNLTHLDYESFVVPSFCLINHSEDLESFVHIDRSHDIRTSFFVKLRKLLTQLNPFQTTLTISSEKIRANIEELRKVPLLDPKPKLENLELHIYSHSPSLLDGLWWSCCPQKLTVPCNEFNQESIKFLCKELMDRGCGDCCGSNQIMCWRHYLKHVEADYFEDYEETKQEDQQILSHRLDWKSLIDRSIDPEEKFIIRFSLDWQGC